MPDANPQPQPSKMTQDLMDIADQFRAAAVLGTPAITWDEAVQKIEALLAPVREALDDAATERHLYCCLAVKFENCNDKDCETCRKVLATLQRREAHHA